ncbi:3-hydroxy-2-methylbutyryl-dehydrogenase [Stylonychia lemnae]|uniref:3-hydroxy-2-methylbutyryl-dehydrogenase n=1 Tax=Stylonychia lemnae TaxID=5949 RepID=A0A078B0A7_STYLE|nr:3-hydroxy-2-methylbutyryl-dehydrogenase [Stylonychia lemnae]|eukprot:CDW87751.1 3-hydroxy-2-methylbutyryl-dehydrogenase [Stylonychia lemnae]
MKITGDLVFFITGGASGLGEATVREIHAKGAKVAVADFNEERLALLEKELKERIFTIKCDVTKEEQVKNAIDKTVEKFGTIHAALACAGIATVSVTLSSRGSLDIGLFKSTTEINVYGSVYVAKYAAQVMSKNKPINDKGEKGVIMFVSSVAAEEGQRGQVAYSSTKGAINGIVLPMARDLGRYGIRVLSIAPGIFMTPLSHAMPENVMKRLNADTAVNRSGTPDEFAHFVTACIENTYLTGVTLRIDGGIKFSNL